MKITVLVENSSRIDNYLLAEAGLSLFIESENKNILFDCGYSSIFEQNAKQLGIDLENITDIIISHGHDDHTGGLISKSIGNSSTIFTAHTNIFDKKFDIVDYSCPVSKEELENRYKLNLTKKPIKISDKLWFLGEIPNNPTKDIDDSAIVYLSNKGLFIITGCSHSGIINIIKYAKKVTGINKIYGIIGGLHLIDKSEDEINDIGLFLKDQKIEYLAPIHCCNLKSKIILSKYIDIEEVCTGDIIEVE